MLPGIETYEAALAAAENVREDAYRVATNARTEGIDWYSAPYEVRQPRNSAYYDAIGVADRVFAEAREGAEDELKTTLVHPVGKWIMDNAWDEYYGEARQALKALTPEGDSLAELDQASSENDWCNVYQGMRRRMLAEGVLKEKNPARSRLLNLLVREGYTRSQSAQMIEEVLAEYVASDLAERPADETPAQA